MTESKLEHFFIRKNNIETEDNFVQLGFTKEYTFYDDAYIVKGNLAPLKSSGPLVLSVTEYSFGNEEGVNERTSYGLFDLFGDLGGLLEILTLIGTALLSIYAEHSFLMKALAKLYKARTKLKGLFEPS